MLHLSELPLAVGVTGSDTPHFPDVLVLDCGKEPIKEARGEEAGGLLLMYKECGS
jgi:hypothetical protein